MVWFAVIAAVLATASLVLSYALTPKPKTSQPDATKDLENPTAEAGRPVPVVFGTVTIKSPNVLWFGEKGSREYKA